MIPCSLHPFPLKSLPYTSGRIFLNTQIWHSHLKYFFERGSDKCGQRTHTEGWQEHWSQTLSSVAITYSPCVGQPGLWVLATILLCWMPSSKGKNTGESASLSLKATISAISSIKLSASQRLNAHYLSLRCGKLKIYQISLYFLFQPKWIQLGFTANYKIL